MILHTMTGLQLAEAIHKYQAGRGNVSIDRLVADINRENGEFVSPVKQKYMLEKIRAAKGKFEHKFDKAPGSSSAASASPATPGANVLPPSSKPVSFLPIVFIERRNYDTKTKLLLHRERMSAVLDVNPPSLRTPLLFKPLRFTRLLNLLASWHPMVNSFVLGEEMPTA